MPQNKSVFNGRPNDSHEQPGSTASRPRSARHPLLKQALPRVLSGHRAVNDDAPVRLAEGGEHKDPPQDGGRTLPVADAQPKLA